MAAGMQPEMSKNIDIGRLLNVLQPWNVTLIADDKR
jgi:hypothetical protein